MGISNPEGLATQTHWGKERNLFAWPGSSSFAAASALASPKKRPAPYIGESLSSASGTTQWIRFSIARVCNARNASRVSASSCPRSG